MFGWLTKLFARSRGRNGAWFGPCRFLRGRYDAAVTNDDNRRHWANADGLSANAANTPEVRRILRNRARYEQSFHEHRFIQPSGQERIEYQGSEVRLFDADGLEVRLVIKAAGGIVVARAIPAATL